MGWSSLRSLASGVHGVAFRSPFSPSAQTHVVKSRRDFTWVRIRIKQPAYGRGGIRTHAGVCPHDFQSCALSHSATRPGWVLPVQASCAHPCFTPCVIRSGSGMDLALLGRLGGRRSWLFPNPLPLGSHPLSEIAPRFHVGSNPESHSAFQSTEGVGFEPTRSGDQRLSRAPP